jgi:hypothetical protein
MLSHESRHGGFPMLVSTLGGVGDGALDDLAWLGLLGCKELKSQTEIQRGMEDLVLGSSLFPAATSNNAP